MNKYSLNIRCVHRDRGDIGLKPLMVINLPLERCIRDLNLGTFETTDSCGIESRRYLEIKQIAR